MANRLTNRQAIFVKQLSKGRTQREATILAGYSVHTADVIGSRLLRNVKIINALEQAGISDRFIAKSLKRHITDGIGVKPTADTSLRALDLATKLKGYQQPEKQETNFNQNNFYYSQYDAMSDEELEMEMNSLIKEIEEAKKNKNA